MPASVTVVHLDSFNIAAPMRGQGIARAIIESVRAYVSRTNSIGATHMLVGTIVNPRWLTSLARTLAPDWQFMYSGGVYARWPAVQDAQVISLPRG